jgi:L-aspartate oxidase
MPHRAGSKAKGTTHKTQGTRQKARVQAGTDFLIIGSGIAGLRAAADLAAHGTVTILTKADPAESNTGYAQGGIAAAIGAEDSPEEHFADTMAAGDGLCDEDAVRVLVDDGVTYVQELLEWGAAFDRDAMGQPALGREGAHRVRRVLHARDATGREIGRVLWSRVANDPRVRVLNHTRATRLIARDHRCDGAAYHDGSHDGEIRAGAVLLATGGAGQVYSDTTNPAIATGDGVVLAWHAGARLADLEFVQFHPTALAVQGVPRFLMSEALRGEGAWLVNGDGERFMTRYERAGDLASRDLVSRAIVSEMARTGQPVYLSMQHLDSDWVHQRFPTIAALCQRVGFDIARDLVPVRPAAHYIMGGVETDIWGRTTLPGLYAAGEVACTGVHGANRLASNSLLEGLVFGARAAKAMLEPPKAGEMNNVRVWDGRRIPPPVEAGLQARLEHASDDHADLDDDVRTLMWNAVGLIRDARTLAPAVDRLAAWCAHSSLATLGYLIARAALRREESRGGHFRADFPSRDDLHWRIHVAERRPV